MNKVTIHPTSLVGKKSNLGKGIEIGPFCIISDGVIIGDYTKISSNVIIEKGVKIGKYCRIGHGVIIGGEPQDLKFKEEETTVEIGDNVILREYVTIHKASGEGEKTIIGNDCYLMVGSHVGHNCRMGEKVILANLVSLGGHVEVENGANIGGLSAVHQFVKIGRLAMVGGGSIVLHDVVPFMMVAGGYQPFVCGINVVGLKRSGYSVEKIKLIKKIYKILFRGNEEFAMKINKLKDLSQEEEVLNVVDFLNKSKRGVLLGKQKYRIRD